MPCTNALPGRTKSCPPLASLLMHVNSFRAKASTPSDTCAMYASALMNDACVMLG